MARIVVKERGELDELLTLAPERYEVASPRDSTCAKLCDVAKLATGAVRAGETKPTVALDTTHAIEGFIALRPLEQADGVKSNKKRIQPGDVIVSRLRPYLRQIAYVDGALAEHFADVTLCCSTEFYVLRPLTNASIAFLVPFLLGDGVQALLARSQEGGHHPRVPAKRLMSLPIPQPVLENRERLSMEYEAVVAALRAAERARSDIVARLNKDTTSK